MKKARLWLNHVLCKILDIYLVFVKFWAENPVFVYVNKKFRNKNLLLDLFSIVLVVFPNFVVHAKCV